MGAQVRHVLLAAVILLVLVILVVALQRHDLDWQRRQHHQRQGQAAATEPAAAAAVAPPTPPAAATAAAAAAEVARARAAAAGTRERREATRRARERYATALEQIRTETAGAGRGRGPAAAPWRRGAGRALTDFGLTPAAIRARAAAEDPLLAADNTAIVNDIANFALGGLFELIFGELDDGAMYGGYGDRVPVAFLQHRHDLEWLAAHDGPIQGVPVQELNLEWLNANARVARGEPLDLDLFTGAAARREDIVAARRQAAAAAAAEVAAAAGAATPAAGRAAAVDTYTILATQHTDNPQNSHDTGVNACERAIVHRLRADQGGASVPTPAAVEADMMRQYAGRPGAELDKVRAVIARTTQGERAIAKDVGDAEALGRVWLRADDPRNAAARAAMREAVYDALRDCWETDEWQGPHIVCVNGRVSRLLGALVTLDWDKRNWVVKKQEQLKNDIFAETSQVIRREAEAAASGEDPDLAAVGRSYLATTRAEIAAVGELKEAAEAAFSERARQAIDRMVDEYIANLKHEGITDAFPPSIVEAVKNEAKAAVAT